MKQTKKSLFPWGKEIDISKELYRLYVFPGGDEVKIDDPKTLVVSDNGHRITGKDFLAHYIPYGWIHLYWENIDKEKYRFYYQRPKSK